MTESQETLLARRTTLRDVARHLGISHVSVSLALRQKKGVSESLRKRVQKAADTLGYRPDPMLQALNNYRHGHTPQTIKAALGFITLWRDPPDMVRRKELKAYLLGARKVAEMHGYTLAEFHPDSKDSLDAVQRVLRARNIEGVLLSTPDLHYNNNCPPMKWEDFCLVRFGHGLGELPIHLVSSAQSSNSVLAMRRIRARGYRRVAWVSSAYGQRSTQFLSGVLRANEEAPSSDRLPPLVLAEKSKDEDALVLKRFVKQHSPDAIFTNIAAMRSLLAMAGYDVPGDIGLAATSVHDCDADAGIDQSPYEIGQTACEILLSLLQNARKGLASHPREILVEGHWVDGKTLPSRV